MHLSSNYKNQNYQFSLNYRILAYIYKGSQKKNLLRVWTFYPNPNPNPNYNPNPNPNLTLTPNPNPNP